MVSIDPDQTEHLNAGTMTETLFSEQPAASELSLADALSLAVQTHRAGDVDDAEILYRRILAIAPEQPDALNFLGMITMHRGRIDEAADLIRRSIAGDPGQGDRYTNLGNVLLVADRIDEAVAAYEQAIALAPAHPAAYSNLGIIYRAQRRFDEAARVYERVIELEPTNAEAYENYGNLLYARGDIHGALEQYAKAFTLRPHDASAKKCIAMAYGALGDLQSAAALYRELLEHDPNHHQFKHLLAACSGIDVPARASDAYIESAFDNFAKTFDATLAQLEYRAPQLVADAVGNAGVVPTKRLSVLDAGCGTGLCGLLLAPYAARLEGVDLSVGMLGKARTRGVYDQLFKGELTEFLRSRHEAYDLVVSADTLVYFGVLADAIDAAWGALRPGGLLIFTVEKSSADYAPEGHRLNPHGRYSHTRDYVERMLANAGFAETGIALDVLRTERGKPVEGFVVTARKALNTE